MWGVAKGAPNRKAAWEFLQFAVQPKPQADFANQLYYGPTNPEAFKHISPEVATTAPDVSGERQGRDQVRHRVGGGPRRRDPGTLHAVAGELSGVALRPASTVRGARRNATAWLLLAPSCLALVLLFVVPIGYVLLLSVTDPRLSLAHYQRIFTVPVYTRVMVNTFVTSLIVTTLCLVIGYPIAYVMARRADWVSTLLLTIVAMSFWTGFLVRTYAWLVILGSKGPVAAAYGALGLGKAPQLLFTHVQLDAGHDAHPAAVHDPGPLRGDEEGSMPTHLKAAASLGAAPRRGVP